MADNTKIEWSDASWNPVRARLLSDPSRVGWHCVHVSDGCRACYAERINLRGIGTGLPYKPGHEKDIEIFIDDRVLLRPHRWAKPRLIFPGSMTDLFASFVTDAMLDRIFAIAAETQRHTYQFLTKRPDRARDYFRSTHRHANILDAASHLPATREATVEAHIAPWPLPNVWIGTSVEDDRVRERIDTLRQVPAAVHWLSIEPMIGRIPNIDLTGIDWVVLGGESGRGARPMHPDWAREIRDACAEQGVPYFFKQWGEYLPAGQRDKITFMADADGRQVDIGTALRTGQAIAMDGLWTYRAGKKAAGRLLDGVLHDAMPGRE